MTRKKKAKKATQENNCFYVSRDRLCSAALAADYIEESSCQLPFTHSYEDTYTMVYNEKHLKATHYDCGCLIYHNQHYHEFKFPELIWMDFFHEGIEPGQKNVKFSVRKCNKK